MIARKKRKLIIIISIIMTVLIIIGTIVALYLTTDIFKSKNKLFVKYLTQNISNIEEIMKQEPTEIRNAIENNKLTSNLKAKIEYTDNEGGVENTINKSELDISSQIDKFEQYNYKNIRLVYENEIPAKMEYIQEGEKYGIRLEGIKQFISATPNNLDELQEKTGIDKKDLEFVTYMFSELKLSDAISFTESELEIISSTYLSVLEQNTEKNQYLKKTNQNIVANGKTCKATEHSLKLTEEQFNNLIIKILEKVEKDEIILRKIDIFQEYLEKHFAYKVKEENLRDIFIEIIDDKIKEIKNNNIGQEETQISIYTNKQRTVKMLIKTPEKTLTIDVEQDKKVQFSYINNEEDKEKQDNLEIERNVNQKSQDTKWTYQQSVDGKEQKNIELQIKQNKEEDKLEGTYQLKYQIEGNTAMVSANQYMNIVDAFENQINLTEVNNMELEKLDAEQVQKIIQIVKENINEKIKNTLNRIKLEDINNILKSLGILKESEIKFEEGEEETVTEVEKNRFNSKLTLYIGKEMEKETLLQMLETAKDCFNDAQIVFEESSSKKSLRGVIMDIKRNTSNPQKIEEIKKALEENGEKKYTVAMAFEENTKLINKITIVSNEFLE